MNTDIEQVLKEGMARHTGGMSMPAGLAYKAARDLKQRQHRMRVATAAGTVTAVAAAGAVVTGAGGASSPGTGHQMQTTAYVVSQVERAIAAAGDGGRIQYAVTRYSALAGVVPAEDGAEVMYPTYRGFPWNAATTVAVARGGTSRTFITGPQGQLVYGESVTTAGKTPVTTAAVYWNRTWWRGRDTYPNNPPGGYPAPHRPKDEFMEFDGGGVSPVMGEWAKSAKRGLAQHSLRIAGHQRVDGVDTLKLAGIPGSTMWVNARTYLPVRVLLTVTFGKRPPPLVQRTDFKLLAPTPANLKLLHLAVPRGFSRVKPY